MSGPGDAKAESEKAGSLRPLWPGGIPTAYGETVRFRRRRIRKPLASVEDDGLILSPLARDELRVGLRHQHVCVQLASLFDIPVDEDTYGMCRVVRDPATRPFLNNRAMTLAHVLGASLPIHLLALMGDYVGESSCVVFTTLSESVLAGLRLHLLLFGIQGGLTTTQAFSIISRYSSPQTKVVEDDDWLSRPRGVRRATHNKFDVAAVNELIGLAHSIKVCNRRVFERCRFDGSVRYRWQSAQGSRWCGR